MANWDVRFLELASHIAGWSKDPSTQVGCVVVGPDREIRSTGFNGFPRGIEDAVERLANREMKYPLVCHAEPTKLMLGAMIEVPAMLWQLDGIGEVADFVSVGSNDHMQFMTASDRGNMLVASRFDPLSRPFLRALRSIVRTVGTIPVTLCGEMAGNPLAAMTLIGLGYRSLSMSPAAVGPVKAMTHALDAGKVTGLLDEWLDAGSAEDGLRPKLTAFAEAEGIPH
jgi:phosphotransferase system enzyme I (PtsP)